MANDNLKLMVGEYKDLASKKGNNAFLYFLSVIALFVFTLAAVVFAETVTECIIGRVETSALAITKEQLEKVELWQGDDFNGIAIMRDGETAAVTGDRGLIMISEGERHSWVKAPSIPKKRSVYGVALSDNGETAVAAGREGLIRFSSDGGETWINPGNITAEHVNGVALSGDGKIAVAVGDKGVARISRNGGKTWAHTDSNSAEDINGIALSQDGTVGIFVGDDGLVRVSSDRGARWNIKNDTREERGDFRAVAVSADGKAAIAVGRRGLVSRSGDSGKSWDLVQSNVGVHLNAVALSGNGAVAVAVGEDGTVLVSTDRGKNWNSRDSKTSNHLNAVALEKGDTAALIVGDDRTILQLTLSGQEELSKITSVRKLQIRRSLSEEEEEEVEKLGERGSQDEYDATKDKVLIYSTGLRIGSILVFLLWVRQMANLMHYNLRLAEYYRARAKAIQLFSSEELSRPVEGYVSSRQERIALLEQLMHAVSPDNIDIGRSPRSVAEHGMRLPRAMLRREAKD